MSPQNSLPRDDEIEVSVFGPGYGESLLIHAGNGCWIAVDSCIDHASRRPRPLRYLEELGVNANTAIHIVVASHWHDDHVRGMHELFKAASSAYFICSTALTSVEFLALADLYASDSSHTTRGPRELYRCLIETAERGKSRWAIADRVLWAADTTINVRLTALSPSDEMNRRSLAFMAQALAAIKRGAKEDRLIESSPNDVAVALRLDVQDRAILLGSDLEEEGDPLVGWSAVLDSATARERRSTTFKRFRTTVQEMATTMASGAIFWSMIPSRSLPPFGGEGIASPCQTIARASLPLPSGRSYLRIPSDLLGQSAGPATKPKT